MTHYLGALTQFINLLLAESQSPNNSWSAISLNFVSKLFLPKSVSQIPHQTGTVNIQADIVNIRVPKQAMKSANVNTRPQREP